MVNKVCLNNVNQSLNGLLPQLLWENPNPTSEFVTQTISLDLSAYRFVEIYANEVCTKVYVGGYGRMTTISLTENDTSIGVLGINRSVQVTSNGITIDICRYCHVGAVTTINNSFLIPLRIYGIK